MDKNLKKKKKCSLWFWHTCDLEIRSRLCHQTWYELLDPKQSYDHTKVDTLPLNSVRQTANVEVFVKSQNTSIISLEYVQKWKEVVYSLSPLTYLTILQSFRLTGYQQKVSVKTVRHHSDLELWPRSLKDVWKGEAQWLVPSRNVWHLSHLRCLRNSKW